MKKILVDFLERQKVQSSTSISSCKE